MAAPTLEIEHIAWLQQRWKLSNAHYKRLGQIASPLTSQTWRDAATGKQALRKLGEPLFTDHALLACVLTGEDITAALDLARSFTPPVFPLGGDDLMAAGFAAGPDLGKLLARLEYYWEEHAYVPDKNALLELAKQLG